MKISHWLFTSCSFFAAFVVQKTVYIIPSSFLLNAEDPMRSCTQPGSGHGCDSGLAADQDMPCMLALLCSKCTTSIIGMPEPATSCFTRRLQKQRRSNMLKAV